MCKTAEFSELIKNFDKIRDYMRDFYVYGFKSREEFTQKSLRTYDNERRRIESYLGEHIKWDTTKSGKKVFISIDSSKISQNPLYAAWKSKSFTNNDILLHFYLLDILSRRSREQRETAISIKELTDIICEKSGLCLDVQTVRIKVNEYRDNGIVKTVKNKKTMLYSLSDRYFAGLYCNKETNATDNNLQKYKESTGERIESSREDQTSTHQEANKQGCAGLYDAVSFYQEAAPFGVVGSYILDNEEMKNTVFKFKHHFIVHTLEDKVLLQVIDAMKKKSSICFVNESARRRKSEVLCGVPLKIFTSGQSGRRYAAMYNERTGRFANYRLDYMKSVKVKDKCLEYDNLKKKLDSNIEKCWGVSFGGGFRGEDFSMTLQIDEQTEAYMINRLEREGRKGRVEKVGEHLFRFTVEVFDPNEIMPWVKSFTGRIVKLECGNAFLLNRFYQDMKRMNEMYGKGE